MAEWIEITEQQATAHQRQAIYRYVITDDHERLKNLIRNLTMGEADQMLHILTSATERTRVEPEWEQLADDDM